MCFYNNLVGRKVGYFYVISVQLHTVTIDKNGIPNTVAIDRVSHAPAMPTWTTLLHPSQTRTRPKANSASDVAPSLSSIRRISKNPTADQHEFTVDCKVRHIGSGPSLKYVVHKYGYTPKDETIEPPEHISQNFITRYWWRIHVNKATNQRNITIYEATCTIVPQTNLD